LNGLKARLHFTTRNNQDARDGDGLLADQLACFRYDGRKVRFFRHTFDFELRRRVLGDHFLNEPGLDFLFQQVRNIGHNARLASELLDGLIGNLRNLLILWLAEDR